MGGTMMATSLFDSNAVVNRGDMSLFAGTVEADEIYISADKNRTSMRNRNFKWVVGLFRL